MIHHGAYTGGQSCWSGVMATQVKIFTMEGGFVELRYYKKMKVLKEETYALLRLHLDKKSALMWPFEFWDNDDKCKNQQKMEGFNDM